MPPEGAKAQRVYLSLRDDIVNGSRLPGTYLPGEQKLAESYGVSRVTIRRALNDLCREGLLKRQAGSGTLVCDTRPTSPPVSMDFSTLMPQVAAMGRNTTAQLLSFRYGLAPANVADALELAEDDQVQIAERIRLTEDLPFSHLTTYVPSTIARHYSEDDLAGAPLFLLLERSGVQIDHAHQTVTASLAGPAVAKALQVEIGSPLLCVQRIVRDDNGQGVEYLLARYRPDLFQLDMLLTRTQNGDARQWQPTLLPSSDSPVPGLQNKELQA